MRVATGANSVKTLDMREQSTYSRLNDKNQIYTADTKRDRLVVISAKYAEAQPRALLVLTYAG